MKVQRAETPAILAGHKAARDFFAPCFANGAMARERLWVAHVDDAARCLDLSRYDGDHTSVGLPVRSIIADAVRLGSAAILLAHNHPSGDATPSDMDRRMTRKLAAAVEAIDCAIVDHLVFSTNEVRSFRQMGLL